MQSLQTAEGLIKWQSGQKYPLELYFYNCPSNHSDSISSGEEEDFGTILEMNQNDIGIAGLSSFLIKIVC